MSTSPLSANSRSTLVLLFTTLVFALLLRYFIVARADFPLNDGGMFYTMITELQDNDFKLPVYSAYNQSDIPYAYPPLPFYFTAALQSLTGVDLFTLLRLLPALFSSLTAPAFFLLSRRILGKDTHAFVAALIFAIQPESFEWEIMGGGITRAPAYLFSILALSQAHQMFTAPTLRRRVWTGLFLGLAALCHLEIAFVSVIFILVMALFFGRSREGLFGLVVAALVMGAVTAPYWVGVLLTHGVAPFLYALTAGEFALVSSLITLMLLHMTVFRSMLVILVILGWFGQMIRREYFLPVLLAACIFIDPRSTARSAILPGAMLASLALLEIILPALQSLSQRARERATAPSSRWGGALLTYLLVLGIFSTLVPHVTGETALSPLGPGERAAMQWITQNTSSEARFLTITPVVIWAYDKTAEWFPTLTGRRNLSTVQGSEWLPDGQFEAQKALGIELKRCLPSGLACLDALEQQYNLAYSHLYLSGFPWNASRLEFDLRNSPDYELSYDKEGVLIFTRRQP